jgi:hypothetical protein
MPLLKFSIGCVLEGFPTTRHLKVPLLRRFQVGITWTAKFFPRCSVSFEDMAMIVAVVKFTQLKV